MGDLGGLLELPLLVVLLLVPPLALGPLLGSLPLLPSPTPAPALVDSRRVFSTTAKTVVAFKSMPNLKERVKYW